MTSGKEHILRWADHVISQKGEPPHKILRISANASVTAIQDAFHALARSAHPDLFRNVLTPEEYEHVTTAYARAAAAYQTMRTASEKAPATPATVEDKDKSGERPIPGDKGPATKPMTTAERFAERQRKMTPERGSQPIPIIESPSSASQPIATANAKAMTYFRKAERALRQGDLRGSVLQLKLAIAADPQSAMLRAALAEVELELKGKK